MNSDKLLIDKKEQSVLKDDIKELIDEIATYIIETLENSSISDMYESGDIEKLYRHMQYPTESIQKKDGKYIIEYTDSIGLLKEYYAASPFGNIYKQRIEKLQKHNNDYVKTKFNKEYNDHCKEEYAILSVLRETRNKQLGHAIERADMGELYIWIKQMMKYLESFIGYRVQVLSKYDERLGDRTIKETLDKYYTKLSDCKKRCFVSRENISEFRFGKNTYSVSENDDDKDDYGMLITDMAQRWDTGISYLKLDKRNDEFEDFLEKSLADMDVIKDYEELRQDLVQVKKDSVEESMIYMDMIYTLYPQISGLYWKGSRYSESYFASIVLQIPSRHPGKYSFEEKIEDLKRRLNESQNWNKTEGDSHRGIGIDIVSLSERSILSKYYRGQNDNKGEKLAKDFEKSVKLALTLDLEDEDVKDAYDSIIVSILSLTAYMRGKTTYMLPTSMFADEPLRVFQDPEDFKKVFINFLNSGVNIKEAAKFVNRIKNDVNLKWWVDNYDSFIEEDE